MVPRMARSRNLLKRAVWPILAIIGAYIMSTSNSSFFTPAYPPPQWTHTPQQVEELAKKAGEDLIKLNDHIVSLENPTIENVVFPVINYENESYLRENMITFYENVSANKELRDASSEALRKMLEVAIEQNSRVDVYRVYKRLYESAKEDEMDPETYRWLEKTYISYKRNGLDLPEDKREEVKRLKVEVSNLCNDFHKNMNEEKGFIVYTAEDLEGVPQDNLDQFEKVEGGYKMTFKYPDVLPVIKYAKKQEIRKKSYIANENKLMANSEILLKVAKLRFKIAKLLGYDTYSDYVLEDRLAKTKSTVMDFLTDLRDKLTPLGKDELERLKEFKNNELKSRNLPPQDVYYAWDHSYYSNLLLEKEYQVDHQKISKYFPLDNTIKQMFSFYETIFDIKLHQIENPDPKTLWHPDAKLLAVYQNITHGSPKNQFMGWLYIDLHPREGKYTHAANFPLGGGYQLSDGGRMTPVTALVCNFTKPTKTKPSLLQHSEVTTFFHELGHGIHNILSQTKYSRFHGTAVPRDFVETPSQMLEFWTWSKNELKKLTAHYETGEPISDDLIDLLIKSKHVNTGLLNLRQLQLGLFDMALHTVDNEKDLETLDLAKLWNGYRESISLLQTDGIKTHGYSTFGHLAGGYESGYYGYLYSQVFANDIYYTLFKKDPMSVESGLKYRDSVLRPGDSRDIMIGLKEVLGREPNSDAFLQEMLGSN